jgi:predicted RNA-binding protein with PUA-like domain
MIFSIKYAKNLLRIHCNTIDCFITDAVPFPHMQHWLMKTEPGTYSWNDLVRDNQTSWTGVRNYQARIHLRSMKAGDKAFIYHSGDEKAIQGIATIVHAAYPDPTAKEGEWVTVDIAPDTAANTPLTLGTIKTIPELEKMVLVKNSRLSVQPVSDREWATIECLIK